MMITRGNLNEVLFENHDARLLIEDVVCHTAANIYYYSGVEITLRHALDIWNRAMKAEENDKAYSVSFFDLARKPVSELLCS